MAGSLVPIAATAMLNWRFGYKLGGDDEMDRQVFAWGLCTADVVKALMPFSLYRSKSMCRRRGHCPHESNIAV